MKYLIGAALAIGLLITPGVLVWANDSVACRTPQDVAQAVEGRPMVLAYLFEGVQAELYRQAFNSMPPATNFQFDYVEIYLGVEGIIGVYYEDGCFIGAGTMSQEIFRFLLDRTIGGAANGDG